MVAKLFFLSVLLISFIHQTYGQNSLQILERQLSIADKKGKIGLSLQIADTLLKQGNEACIGYGLNALDLSKQLSENDLIIHSLLLVSKYYRELDHYDQAKKYLNEAADLILRTNSRFQKDLFLHKVYLYQRIFLFDSVKYYARKTILADKKKEDPKTEITCRLALGIAFTNQDGDYPKAFDEFLRALELSTQHAYYEGLFLANLNIGVCYSSKKEYEKALTYTKKSLRLSQGKNDPAREAQCYHALGRIYYWRNMLDSARINLNLALRTYKNLPGRPRVHLYLAWSYQGLNQYDSAMIHYKKVLQTDLTANKTQAPWAYHGMAETYLNLHQINKALIYADSAQRHAESLKDLTLWIKIYDLYRQIYLDQKDFKKAYDYFALRIHAEDSLESMNNFDEIAEVKAAYEIKKKEDRIRILDAENKLKNTQLYALIGFVVIFVIALLLFINRYQIVSNTRKKLLELDRLKSNFFTNISHEFRTPLSLIMGPIQQEINETLSQDKKARLDGIYRNAKRLHHLIDQLMDLSKLDSNKITLKVCKTELTGFLRMIYSCFTFAAKSRGMKYTLDLRNEPLFGYIDQDAVQKILSNLISNAFKFTPKYGKINLTTSFSKDNMLITIQDNGIGIPKERVHQIFNRFYQADNSITRASEGSGIGLALSKELCSLHKGILEVDSTYQKGSVFRVTIPISAEAYSTQEIISLAEISDTNSSPALPVLPEIHEPVFFPDSDRGKPVLLIAEDNLQMQTFISDLFRKKFLILTASSGIEAWDKALEKIPDLIITDHMMPAMSGIALCEKIKRHQITSHIPLIILTAVANQETKLEGLKYHADAYLTKPFDIEELQLTASNLVEGRKKLKTIFTKRNWDTVFHSIAKEKSVENEFLVKLMNLIDENYQNTNFGVELLAQKIGMSRMQLHRKVKSLTNFTPSDMLRYYRLEKAKEYLATTNAQIGEIAFQVGFNSVSNFAKIFKDYTGLTPSEYNTQLILITQEDKLETFSP